jgi:hypothetical protein
MSDILDFLRNIPDPRLLLLYPLAHITSSATTAANNNEE